MVDRISDKSLAPDIIRDLRRAVMLRRIAVSLGLHRHSSVLEQIKQQDIGTAHVYDTGHLLDVDHPDYISVSEGYALLEKARELQCGEIGLFMPHPKTSFIWRSQDAVQGWGIYVNYAEEQRHFIQTSTFFRTERTSWFWLGGCTIWRQAERNDDQIAASLIHDDIAESDIKEVQQSLLSDPLVAAMLLLEKSDTIEVEPAPWWPADEPAKPKAYETRNPSVSVVRVNTPRIIVRPPRDNDGSGAKVRPHDVRSHLRRRGNKIIQVRAHTRNGGASAIVPKVVQIDKPL